MERTLQYYMLSYLAVFRLGRQLGAFKRKRKTPLDYSGERNANNKGEMAIAKLVKDIIEHIVSQSAGHFTTNNLHTHSGSQMYLYIAQETRNLLQTYTPSLVSRSPRIINYLTTEEEKQIISQAWELNRTIDRFQQSSQVNFTRWSAITYYNTTNEITLPGANSRIYYSNAHTEALKFINIVKAIQEYAELMIKFKPIEDRLVAEDLEAALVKASDKKKKQKSKDVDDLTSNLRTLLRMDASDRTRTETNVSGPNHTHAQTQPVYVVVDPPVPNVSRTFVVTEPTVAVPESVNLTTLNTNTAQQRFDEALRRRRGEV